MEIPQPGDVLLDKYRLDEVLGEGGFGVVFLATTLQSDRPVAIKVLKPGTEGYNVKRAARFTRELRTIAKLHHPNTLTMYDYGRTDDGLMFMVTEYVEGEDLGDLLKRKVKLSELETAHIVVQVLEALREAHDIGVLHRDIKPANIRVFEYGGDPLRVKVLDFGLAKSLSEGEVKLTEAGKVVGTPRFMSPEQLRGKKLNAQTDIYSLGLVTIELLLGRREGLKRTASRRPTLTAADRVRREMRLVVNKMVARKRSDRYQSAADVLLELGPMVKRLRSLEREQQPRLLPRAALAPAPEGETEEIDIAPTEEDIVPPTARLGIASDELTTEDGHNREYRGPTSSRRSISLAVERVPAWVWGTAILVAVALVWSMLHLYDTFTKEPSTTSVVKTSVDGSALHTGSPGCGNPAPFRGYGTANLAGKQTPLFVPRGYDPFGDIPVILMFRGKGGYWLFHRDRLVKLANEEDVLIVVVGEAEEAAPVLAAVAKKLCVDMRHVFGVGLEAGADMLLNERCDLPLRAMVAIHPSVAPTKPCDEPVPLRIMLTEGAGVRKAKNWSISPWHREYGCKGYASKRHFDSALESTWTCDRGRLSQLDHTWDANGDAMQVHTAIWRFFYAHLDL